MSRLIATSSRLGRMGSRLLVLEGQEIIHTDLKSLVEYIPANSLMVVNKAATLPASFQGLVGSLPVELRLVHNLTLSTTDVRSWQALVFYRDDWTIPTEERQNPDFLEVGDEIEIGNLVAEVTSILHPSKRLVTITFQGSLTSIWQKIYQFGKPIQYSHLQEALELWDVQTIFSSLPVSMEPASASFQLTWDLINQLVAKGVEIVGITHATSISSTGIEDLDRLLPFPEYYWIDKEVAQIINNYHQQSRPIIAVGTSVTRALEDNTMRFDRIRAGEYRTYLKITGDYCRKMVTGLFTGMHLPQESHIDLLRNFVPSDLLTTAYQEAVERGYLWHEYGDVNLILPQK